MLRTSINYSPFIDASAEFQPKAVGTHCGGQSCLLVDEVYLKCSDLLSGPEREAWGVRSCRSSRSSRSEGGEWRHGIPRTKRRPGRNGSIRITSEWLFSEHHSNSWHHCPGSTGLDLGCQVKVSNVSFRGRFTLFHPSTHTCTPAGELATLIFHPDMRINRILASGPSIL